MNAHFSDSPPSCFEFAAAEFAAGNAVSAGDVIKLENIAARARGEMMRTIGVQEEQVPTLAQMQEWADE